MELLIKAAGLAVFVAVYALLLRKTAPELSLLLSLAGITLILLAVLPSLRAMRELSERLQKLSGHELMLLSPVLKCVGIGILTKFSSELCRDAGQGALSSVMQSVGTLAAFLVALPLLLQFLSLVEELL